MSFESSNTGVIHNRKVGSDEDLLPRSKFTCWKHHNDEVSIDLPALRRPLRVVDCCCNPLSVRYACRPIVRPWPAVVTIFLIVIVTYIFAVFFTVNLRASEECIIDYPSIIVDLESEENVKKLLIDKVNYPWVEIGEVDSSDESDIFRLDTITVSPTACGSEYETFLEGPVALYYQLKPFYQNHRLYIFSRSNSQLHGEYLTAYSAISCSPVVTLEDAKTYWGDIPAWWAKPPDNLAPDNEVVLHPCGVQAISTFNDTFEVSTYDDEPIE
eukprot:GHVH01005444.1.p1 GENE.GHVH01005444.1~~GHVH01005444.1.p1  ORF type:complete len:270 (+),score=31.07 GHVH01005444.1:67-876(+)